MYIDNNVAVICNYKKEFNCLLLFYYSVFHYLYLYYLYLFVYLLFIIQLVYYLCRLLSRV